MKKEPKPRWKPAGAIAFLDKDRLGTVYLYTRKGQPAAVGYSGKRTKPDLHITQASITMLERTVARWFDGLRDRAKQAQAFRSRMAADDWSRNNVIKRIRQALAERGIKASVSGGHGTGWGWIQVDLLPSVEKLLTPERRREEMRKLNEALGLAGANSISIPSSTAHYREYVERAQGKTPTKVAEPYWD